MLINEYGDLDTLLERASEIKQNKRRENLIEFADQARISRDLVTLKQDVPVVEALDQFALRDPESEPLLAFLVDMEFSKLTARIADSFDVKAPVKVITPSESGPTLASQDMSATPYRPCQPFAPQKCAKSRSI